MAWSIAQVLVSLLLTAQSPAVRQASNDDEPGAKVGERPYELDWAQRQAPDHPPLLGFDDLSGWRTAGFDGAEAQLYRSRQQWCFARYSAEAVYSGVSDKSRFVIAPPQPIPIPGEFTAVDLWVRGNNWVFAKTPATPPVTIVVLILDAYSREWKVPLGLVNFDYWFQMHANIPNARAIALPASFAGIQVSGCSAAKPARLFFDALSFYGIQYPSLQFAPIPTKLPWPTTPDTIRPTCKETVKTDSEQAPGEWAWTAVDSRDSIRWRYHPGDGSLSDLTVEIGGRAFQPCWTGGLAFPVPGGEAKPGVNGLRANLMGTHLEGGDTLVAQWSLRAGSLALPYRYVIDLKGKSLVVDISTNQGVASRLDIGQAKGLRDAKAIVVPYLTYYDGGPKIVCSRAGKPIFLSALLDWYNSDASQWFGLPAKTGVEGVAYNGGATYLPSTAGRRNPVRERLFLTASGDVQEVLPNIPNPPCDTGPIARECVYRNIGFLYQNKLLTQYKALGIDKFIVCHHGIGWQALGESFTLRDRPAPSIGQERMAAYGAFVRGLGYRFGTYTNYVDYAPVNGNWRQDDVALAPSGQWQRAWPRCYTLKPLRAVEYEALYAPRIHQLYGTTAQYLDVHTAFPPWIKTDYDARIPGAAMFRTTFNAYARLLWNESPAHDGPVISEGGAHWLYAGIVDGNYGQFGRTPPFPAPFAVPHFIDFDLLKMHPKMTDVGMGMPVMYYGKTGDWTSDHKRLSPFSDRFLAATIAFGHIGFLTEEWEIGGTLKSYYLLQALQQRYAMIPVEDIRYFNGQALVDSSTALATDAYLRQQIYVRYAGGLETWTNLSFDDEWTVTVDGRDYRLPPSGFVARKPGDILEYSAEIDGARHDLVDCDAYLYLDSRDHPAHTKNLAVDGIVAVKREGANAWRMIPAGWCDAATISKQWLRGDPTARFSAQGYDVDGKAVGPAQVSETPSAVTVKPLADPTVVNYRLEAKSATGG
ncbi:MAG: hypothetical protein NTW86_19975 [Candidatus Sumerlaeota bacterium]|nr:hypothetical protein [Candidatus Sumerlaeota bacterium]